MLFIYFFLETKHISCVPVFNFVTLLASRFKAISLSKAIKHHLETLTYAVYTSETLPASVFAFLLFI